jgi:hypothetical protein
MAIKALGYNLLWGVKRLLSVAGLPENNKITAVWQKLSWNNFKRGYSGAYSFAAEGVSRIGSVIQQIFAYFFPSNARQVVHQSPASQEQQSQPFLPLAGQFLSPQKYKQATAEEMEKNLAKSHSLGTIPSVEEPSIPSGQEPATLINRVEAYASESLVIVRSLLLEKNNNMYTSRLKELETLIESDLVEVRKKKGLLSSGKEKNTPFSFAQAINKGVNKIFLREEEYRKELLEISKKVAQIPSLLPVHKLSPGEYTQTKSDENENFFAKTDWGGYTPLVPEPSFQAPKILVNAAEISINENLSMVESLLLKKPNSAQLKNLKTLIEEDQAGVEKRKKILLTMSPEVAKTINNAMNRILQNEKNYKAQLEEISTHNEN